MVFDGVSVILNGEMGVSSRFRTPFGRGEELLDGGLRISFHRGLYQELLALGRPPDLAVALHAGASELWHRPCVAGIQEYDTWLPALRQLLESRIPTAVTGYSLADGRREQLIGLRVESGSSSLVCIWHLNYP